MKWAGPMKKLCVDPLGGQVSEETVSLIESRGVILEPCPAEAAWKHGKVERHGDVLRDMIHKVMTEQDSAELEDVIDACCVAKNNLVQVSGYTPSQWVLSQNPRVPEQLLQDQSSMSMWDFENHSESFRALVELRISARQAYIFRLIPRKD